MSEPQGLNLGVIFTRGEPIPPPWDLHFTGECYSNELVPFDGPLGCVIGSVTFAPGARNHWHAHSGGQMLLVTGGRGWYQEVGKAARALRAGDVVQILPHVKHWHGAAADSWFVHLAIEPDVKGGPPVWFEGISEEEYSKLE